MVGNYVEILLELVLQVWWKVSTSEAQVSEKSWKSQRIFLGNFGICSVYRIIVVFVSYIYQLSVLT